MKCDNCGKREANVRYSENINGKTKELNLCEECSQKLGITNMDFNMPIDFSSFFGEFMEDFATPEFMPVFNEVRHLKCNNCGYTFEDIANTGKLGCENCYDVFEEKLDPIIRKIQGANHHVRRIGKMIDKKIDNKIDKKLNESQETKTDFSNKKESNKEDENKTKIEKLQIELKQAIKEERYEDAAKIRDEIKKLEK